MTIAREHGQATGRKGYDMNNSEKYWAFVNRCDMEDPVETRRRCAVAEGVLAKAPISIDDYDAMMDTLAYLVRESYHR